MKRRFPAAGKLTGIKCAGSRVCKTGGVKMTLETDAEADLESGALRTGAASERFSGKRLAREWQTMGVMIRCYCRAHHGSDTALCPDCRQLLDYAGLRLERCRFGAAKPACANCPVHCYLPKRREQIREVMRYAGPRMLWRHPLLAILHKIDGYRKAPNSFE